MRTFIFITAAALVGCAGEEPTPVTDDTDVTLTDDTGVTTIPEDVTFADLQEEIFLPSCGGAGCHDAATNAGGLDLESEGAFDRLMNDPCENEIAVAEGLVRVAPGDPSESFLFLKLTDPRGMGDIMPPWGALDDDVLLVVEDWIQRGAEP